MKSHRSYSRSAAAVSAVVESKRGQAPLDGFIHPQNWEDEESIRRARLQIRFGVLAGIAAILYAGFFFAIGNIWGGLIIGVSGLLTTQVPWVVRRTGNLKFTGYLYGLVLLLGFTGICVIDGGINGNGIAWLASVPLVVLLLVDLRGALVWSAMAFGTVTAMAICQFSGYDFPTTYDPEWSSAVAAISAIGLAAFLAFLGLIFEQTRSEAFRRMHFANGQLAAANADLQALNREKGEFMNIAAHGLRNPLGIVTGYADLLRIQKEMNSEQVQRQAGEILNSAGRMNSIISNLLDVQAIEEDRMNLENGPLDLENLVTLVRAENAPVAAAKEIGLRLSVNDELPPVFGDQEAIHQILENLVSNAIKYSSAGNEIAIKAGHGNGLVVVEVQDNGPGLSEEDQSRLFEKFSRLTPRPTGGEPSSGLGLWISKRLAKAMGGDVFCRSEEGEGSMFGLSLSVVPLAVGEQGAQGSPEVKNQDGEAKSPSCFSPGKPLLGRLHEEIDAGASFDEGVALPR